MLRKKCYEFCVGNTVLKSTYYESTMNYELTFSSIRWPYRLRRGKFHYNACFLCAKYHYFLLFTAEMLKKPEHRMASFSSFRLKKSPSPPSGDEKFGNSSPKQKSPTSVSPMPHPLDQVLVQHQIQHSPTQVNQYNVQRYDHHHVIATPQQQQHDLIAFQAFAQNNLLPSFSDFMLQVGLNPNQHFAQYNMVGQHPSGRHRENSQLLQFLKDEPSSQANQQRVESSSDEEDEILC